MSLLNVGAPSAAWPYIKAIAKPLTVPGTTIGLAALTDLQDDLANDQFQDRVLRALEGIHSKSSEISEQLRIRESLSVDAETLRLAAKSLSEEIYLKRLADKYFHADFKGIAQINRLLSLPLDDVFVDLKVVYEEQEESRKIKESALKKELESSDGENAQRLLRELESSDSNLAEAKGAEKLSFGRAIKEPGAFVLLGGPGSGKTTLVKRLARSCALGDAVLRQRYVEMPWGFPVVVPITQFATQGRGRSLLEYVEDVMRDKGGEALLDVYRDYWMSGKVLLLLDGLDEVADVNQRISSARAVDEVIQTLGANRLVLHVLLWVRRRI